MRSICTTVAITAAGLLLFSGFAQASDVEAELRQMQERIADLESQLGSETDSFLLQEESGSFVSAMLENTDIGGFAAGSYNYNFEGFHNNDALGEGGNTTERRTRSRLIRFGSPSPTKPPRTVAAGSTLTMNGVRSTARVPLVRSTERPSAISRPSSAV